FVIDVNGTGAAFLGAEPALQIPFRLGCLALVGALSLPFGLHGTFHKSHKRRTFSVKVVNYGLSPRTTCLGPVHSQGDRLVEHDRITLALADVQDAGVVPEGGGASVKRAWAPCTSGVLPLATWKHASIPTKKPRHGDTIPGGRSDRLRKPVAAAMRQDAAST